MAVWLRGGRLPPAYVYPAQRRAPRDLLRRRTHLRRKRTARFAHVHNPNSQYHWPEVGKKMAYNATRDGGAERVADPAVPKNIEGDLALFPSSDHLLTALELALLKAAQHHDANTLYLVHTVPGIGKMLRRVLLDAIHDMHRFPRGQDCGSSCRLVTCAKEAAGKRLGPSGKQSGNADLQWALSAAVVLFLRTNPAGQNRLARWEQQHGTGQALPILAPSGSLR